MKIRFILEMKMYHKDKKKLPKCKFIAVENINHCDKKKMINIKFYQT